MAKYRIKQSKYCDGSDHIIIEKRAFPFWIQLGCMAKNLSHAKEVIENLNTPTTVIEVDNG